LKDIQEDDGEVADITGASRRSRGALGDEKKAESAALYGNDILYP